MKLAALVGPRYDPGMKHYRLLGVSLLALGFASLSAACEGSGGDAPLPDGGDGDGNESSGGNSAGVGGTSSASGGRTGGTAGSLTGGAQGSDGGAGGEGNPSAGGSASRLECEVDDDCVAVGDTGAACYSAGCSLPSPASKSAMAADRCLVEWTGTEGPSIPRGCEFSADEEVLCPALCAQAPACIHARCEAGVCAVDMSQEPGTCDAAGSGGGKGTDCEALNSRRESTLEEARNCLPNGIVAECGDSEKVPNQCGCPVAVNSNQSERVAQARAAYSEWNAACEPPAICALLDCAQASAASACVSENEGASVCQWQ